MEAAGISATHDEGLMEGEFFSACRDRREVLTSPDIGDGNDGDDVFDVSFKKPIPSGGRVAFRTPSTCC